MAGYTRRDFVQAGAGVAAGFAFARPLHAVPWERAATIRVGLVGCGGRGTGAARDCLRGSEGVELVAMGDLFPDRVASARENLAKAASENPAFAAKYKVDDGHAFSGIGAYQQVLASGIDLVILATPPGFRPLHFAAAVDAGKHVFMEKPVAVDPTGVRAVIAAAARAQGEGAWRRRGDAAASRSRVSGRDRAGAWRCDR